MSRFIQTQYNYKQPENYYRYMDHAILPIEKALAHVSSSMDRFDHNVNMAKSLYHNSSVHKLSIDESAAIYLYTISWGKNSLHNVLNRALNSGNYALIRPWFGFLKLFTTALQKLPTFQGVIWRGLDTNLLQRYRENDELTWWNVSSCSSSLVVLRRHLDENSILCSIEVLNGKNIRGFSDDSNADEILLLPGTRLRVKSNKFDRSTGGRFVELEEMNSNDSKTSTSSSDSTSSTNSNSKHQFGKNQSKSKKLLSTTTFSNGARYYAFENDGKNQNYGIYQDVRGVKEEGPYTYLKANGEGLRISSNRDRYEGTFHHNRMTGYGSLLRADRYTYVGEWFSDQPFGEGISAWPNGNRYEGYHQDGKITGHGIFYSDNGDKYEGRLEDGKAHGKGLRIWKNGDQYEGHFKCDKKYGSGAYKYATGAEYRGNWVDDEMNGQGTFKWASGTRYVGEFKDGKRHGQGKLTYANGKVQDGRWQNDQYMG